MGISSRRIISSKFAFYNGILMKTVTLNIDETLYDTLLAMLNGLPKQKIEIIEQGIDDKAQTREQGKNIMRELSAGLGTSSTPHDGSVNHDNYLYQ